VEVKLPAHVNALAHSPIGEWTEEQNQQFELAQDALSALVADCTRRIAEAGSQQEIDRLLVEQMNLVIRRRDLDPRNDVQVAEALADAERLLGEVE